MLIILLLASVCSTTHHAVISLLATQFENLDLAPSNLKMTLDWVKAAFGQRARLGFVTLLIDPDPGPRLHARFPYQLDKNKPRIDIELRYVFVFL